MWLMVCSKCGQYAINKPEFDNRQPNIGDRDRQKLQILLTERLRHGRPTPFLVFENNTQFEANEYVAVRVKDLLLDFPRHVPERLRRAFVNLVGPSPKAEHSPGDEIEISMGMNSLGERQLFSFNGVEAEYMLDTFAKNGWIEIIKQDEYRPRVRITADGWKKFDDLTTGAPRENPVFVAMWFGKPKESSNETDRREEMRCLFDEAIVSACDAAGYRRCIRSDDPEHNDGIMDQIIADIRKAPFVIAELTNNNPGVYYEAGFARGIGKEVIYCCPEGTIPHFDVSGINLVMYPPGQLKERLRRRIIGSDAICEGPFQSVRTNDSPRP